MGETEESQARSPLAPGTPVEMPEAPEEIYVGLALIEEAGTAVVMASQRTRLSMDVLLEFVIEPGRRLSAANLQTLLATPRLRRDLAYLQSAYAAAELPALVAASDQPINERRFSGGSLKIVPSRTFNQVYVRISYALPRTLPRSIMLQRDASQLVKRELPDPGDKHEVMIVCDPNNPDDREFLELLGDPMATGTFLI